MGTGQRVCQRYRQQARLRLRAGRRISACVLSIVVLAASLAAGLAADLAAQQAAEQHAAPPRVRQARQFLARRGSPRHTAPAPAVEPANTPGATPADASPYTTPWRPVGPIAVGSGSYGLTTGRVTSLALDPSDATGNRLFVGTTGGGVWLAQNAATSNVAQLSYKPLTDAAIGQLGAVPPTPSIGALAVQPGGTGVILAGTGDPNDALDSYYGDGILLSKDNGHSWTRIEWSADQTVPFSFAGLGFAGFAWSSDPNLVVAAVSRAYEATLVRAEQPSASYTGLYYSTDAGATWRLSQIKDLSGSVVQGPLDAWAGADGNPATAVVWNPVRRIFLAAIRYHGYYQSSDGITWTRLASQPGAALTTTMCPTNTAQSGSPACPIFRGALAVNPVTGDTFAWTVDINNQDQGIWQDVCAATAGSCASNTLNFAKQWSTTALETNTWQGAGTILDGDYNLVLAAVPSQQDTLLLAGGNDVWRCSLAMGCAWRNTTSVFTCASGQVAPYQHAFEWNRANPQQVLVGNDGGLWRSMDAIAETGGACSSTDATHWQNLNTGLGSLAEVESFAAATPTTLLTGLGANGTAGVKGGTTVPATWPEILSGKGGPVAIDPTNPPNWYVNNGAGVSIHACKKAGACTAADFGAAPLIGNANVNNDGLAMTAPAAFAVDPVDPTQLLVATCRVWRGPASGAGWTLANAVSPMFDGNVSNPSCHGNALIRSIAAMALPGNAGEVVYAGTYGYQNGGASLPGHVLRGVMNSNGTWTWQDLSFNPVLNDPLGPNASSLDVSSISIDPSDNTGNTVYFTLAGLQGFGRDVQPVLRSTDGGAHWVSLWSNLPNGPANAVAVDPSNSNIVYVAADAGVFVTQAIATCGQSGVNCWATYGSGLPQSPAVALSVLPASQTLIAATYGRGLWQIPLLGATFPSTTAAVQPASVTFPGQIEGTISAALPVVLTNTGAAPLMVVNASMTGDFDETDNCLSGIIAPAGSCTFQITFIPSQAGPLTGTLTLQGNIPGGSLSVPITGTGLSPGNVYFIPASLNFGSVAVGSKSPARELMIENIGKSAVGMSSLTLSGPFRFVSNVCGPTTLAADADCQIMVEFVPLAGGPATGVLTLVDDAGTQTAQLQGLGVAPPTDTLSPASVTFKGTIIGQQSSAATVTLTNSGSNQLNAIQESITGPFTVTSNCGTQLIGGASCAIYVVFTPTAQGTQIGDLTVSDAMQTQVVPLSGTGLLPPTIAVNPAQLSFGGQVIGQAGAPLSLAISNTGGADMAGLNFQITGTAGAAFATGATTCAATLSAGASCAVQVIFTAPAAGPASASLTVSSSTAGVVPVVVPLTGTGNTAAGLTASPAQLTFGSEPAGVASAPQSVTVTNNGGSAATGLVLSATAPFAIGQNGCSAALAAGGNCSATVIFTPAQNGPASGTLTIAAANVTTATTVALTGTGGLTGIVQAQPAAVAFPATGVGAVSSPVTVTINNTSASATLQGLTLAASAGFQLGSTTCTTSLAAAASCTAAVQFAPAAAGAASGTLTISSSTLAAPVTVALSGTGFDFAITNPGSASQTVASGQTANYTLTLAPGGGMGATFTFACGTLPQYAACVFSPASNTVAANATASETLQITTSQTSALAFPPTRPGYNPLMLALGLLCLPLLVRRRRLFAAAVLAVAFVAGMAGCAGSGGGGGSSPSNPTTHTVAAGTYSVPVQVTADGLEHTITVTLTVN